MSYIPKSEYVPTTDEIETAFHEFASELESESPGEYEQAPEFSDWREAMHGFRRWHAEEIRKAKEKAWFEGAESAFYNPEIRGLVDYPDKNPYRKETE